MTLPPPPARPVVLVATFPFGEASEEPVTLLAAAAAASGATIVRHPHRRVLRPAELLPLLRDADAVVAGTERYDAAALAAAPRLRLLARTGVGVDAVDLDAARARGVAVTSTPDAPSASAAELAVGLLIGVARQVGQADRAMRAGRWERRTGVLLEGRTVGIVGLGRIGTRVARALRAFGCRVVATDIDPAAAVRADAVGAILVSLDQLLAQADAVTLHVPLTPLTRGLVSAAALGRMRRGAFLVNTSRGEVVDEAALLAALRAGHLGGAGLDVYADEPYTGPLAAREDVLLTAHMGSCTDAGRRAMELGAARSVAAWLTGQPVEGRVV